MFVLAKFWKQPKCHKNSRQKQKGQRREAGGWRENRTSLQGGIPRTHGDKQRGANKSVQSAGKKTVGKKKERETKKRKSIKQTQL